MSLKFKLKSKDEVSADQQAFYVERDGGWVLDVEGAVDKARLDEFRANNTALASQLDEHKKRFAGIDPDAFRKLSEEKQRLEEAQQLKSGEIDKVIERRVLAARSDWDKQLTELTSERDALNARLTAIQIDQGVVTAATKRGLRSTAFPDITARARNVFKLVDGTARAMEADGKSVRIGKDGFSPMTLDEWVEQQVAEAPHLFEPNAGGGGVGGAGVGARALGGERAGRNPFRKETWNLTEQMRLEKSDPALAARLRAAVDG